MSAANVPSSTAPAVPAAAGAVVDGITEEPVAPVPEPAVVVEAAAAGVVPPVPTPTLAYQAKDDVPPRPRWNVVGLGYALAAVGLAVIPFVPGLKSPLLARLTLVGSVLVLMAGMGAVLWGYVGDALRRRG